MGAWVNESSLRARRRRSTRREIARAALNLVLERGLADVTVEDIAEAAGVSPRTFFNYFPSKKSAVVAGPEPLPDEAIEVFVTDRRTPVLDGLRLLLTSADLSRQDERQIVCQVQQVVVQNPDLIPVLHERLMAFESVLADAVARRLGVSVEDDLPVVTAAVCTTLLRVAMTKHMSEPADRVEVDIGRTFDALRELVAAN
jgi:AcrR family transcriptional regulator